MISSTLSLNAVSLTDRFTLCINGSNLDFRIIFGLMVTVYSTHFKPIIHLNAACF